MILPAIALILLLGGCGRPEAVAPEPPAEPPRRVVALAPSAAEQLFALGLGERVVGVSDFCDWPPEVCRLPSVGSYANPSLEAVVSLEPDLVLAAFGTRRSSLERLKGLGIEVRGLHPRTVQEAIASLGQVARWCGSPGVERELAASLTERLEAVRAAVRGAPRPRVFIQLYPGELYTTGARSLQGDLIHEAGGVNVAEGITLPYPRLSLEQVLALAPEVILIVTDDVAAFERERRRWLALPLPAAKSGAVHRLPIDLVQRPGPRMLSGLELVAARLHPERFPVKGD